MDQEINQYLSAQREQSNSDHRDSYDHDRQRDRLRRRDRDRDRRRKDRGPVRERERERDRSRERYEPPASRPDEYEFQGYNGFTEGISPAARPTNGDYDKGHTTNSTTSANYINDDYDNYSEGSQPESYSRDGSSRDYSRDSRERSSDRDRDGRDRDSREGRDGRDSRDSHRDRDYGREEKGGERWMTANPTNTILLRGLVAQIDEKDIRAELMMFGAPIKEVRLMKRKDTGEAQRRAVSSCSGPSALIDVQSLAALGL